MLECQQEIVPSRLSSGHTICNQEREAGMNTEEQHDNNTKQLDHLYCWLQAENCCHALRMRNRDRSIRLLSCHANCGGPDQSNHSVVRWSSFVVCA